jgi:hypothetical protein
MRRPFTVALGVLVVLAAACGGKGGTTTSGTTGTAATSGGASTTGGSGTSTGGTTTGGGLTPGATCTANGQCLSGVCDVHGSGHCCRAACSTRDATCGATACDDTGACTYPTGASCGSSCSGNMLTAKVCNASGTCTPATPTPCPNHLACNSSATACVITCVDSTGCVSGYYCNRGSCAVPQATGPCASSDACTSGICGVIGTGHCCTAACSTTDLVCGATDCDGTGACAYPSNLTSCGPGISCTGTTQTDATACDGKGTCAPPHTKDCSPYKCGASACLGACSDATSCASGAFCDSSVCCSLTKFGTVNVDGVTGNDAVGCCGIGANAPCDTLKRAMSLIDKAKVSSVTINATIDGGGGDWSPDGGEVYPIVLGWGVELNAPGVYFYDPVALATGFYGQAVFDINNYSSNDTVGYASMVGSAARQIGVGMNSTNPPTLQAPDVSTILVESGNSLYLANATVNGSSNFGTNAIYLNPGAKLVVGEDQSGAVTGTVNVGNSLGSAATDGWWGIVCGTDMVSLGCTIQDAPLVGQSALVIQGQEFLDIDAEDFANITLTANPVIGVPPSAAGFGKCPQKNDAMNPSAFPAVLIIGKVTFTFKNGTAQCISGAAFGLGSSPNGNPTVTIDSTTFQNTDLGVWAQGGTATITNSTFSYNYNGVQQDTDGTNNGTVDLSGGGNTVICSSNVESSQGSSTPGVDVFNSSTAVLKADKVAWDTTGPDYFQCDSSRTVCLCNNASCSTDAGSDGMDAVEVGDAGITTTGSSKSANGCK